MAPTLKDHEPQQPAMVPDVQTSREVANTPAEKKGLRKAFGEWLDRQTIGTLLLPAGLWVTVGALLGVYGDTAGLWGLNVLIMGLPNPKTIEDDEEPRGDVELAGRRIWRLARRAYRLLWLPGAVLMEICWVRFALHDAPRWLLPALLVFVGALMLAGPLFSTRLYEPSGRPRRADEPRRWFRGLIDPPEP